MDNAYINCGHYTRGCQFVSPCCNNIVRCRLCHDDTYLDHQINRYEINEIVCNKCSLHQPVSNYCIGCNLQFGEYYCDICRLYICNRNDDFYHCNKCKICRVGNTNTLFHCDTCDVCLPLEKKDNHICKSNMLKTDCIICCQDLFTSTKPTIKLPCQHILHSHCAIEWMKRSIGCPLCRKTMMEGETLHKYIEELDNLILNMPVEPEEIMNAYCNECNLQFDVKFHPFGLKCNKCGGYNTKL